MPNQTFLDAFPLGAVFALALSMVLGSVELGFRLGVRRTRRQAEVRPASIGTIVGATMGLLAFMLAFTFGQASARFDTRRLLVLEEANTIREAYLRADLLAEPGRSRVRALLREYVGVRANATREGRLAAAIARSEQIQESLWAAAVAFAGEHPGAISGLFAQSVNELTSLHYQRGRAALHSRIPAAILGTLFFVAVLAMASMGYHAGLATARTPFVTFALALAFSAVMFLIYDLDRAQEGTLRVGQEAMVELAGKLGP